MTIRMHAGRSGWLILAAVAAGLLLTGCQTTGNQPASGTKQVEETLSDEQVARALDGAERALDQDRPADARKILQQVSLAGHASKRAIVLNAAVALALGEPNRALETLRPFVDPDASRTTSNDDKTAGADQALEGKAASTEKARSDINANEIDDPAKPSARAMRTYGLALVRLNRFAQAEPFLTEASAIDPTDWRVWNGLAFIADRGGAFDRAEGFYVKALANGGSNAQVYNNRGFSRLLQGRPDDAIEDLGEALRRKPGMQIAETNMRLALAWRGDYTRAVSGVAADERSRALNNAGFVALMRGDYPAAERYLTRALNEDAGFNKQAYRNLTYLRSITAVDGDGAADAGAVQTGVLPSRN